MGSCKECDIDGYKFAPVTCAPIKVDCACWDNELSRFREALERISKEGDFPHIMRGIALDALGIRVLKQYHGRMCCGQPTTGCACGMNWSCGVCRTGGGAMPCRCP
jgi:hypothetical protein